MTPNSGLFGDTARTSQTSPLSAVHDRAADGVAAARGDLDDFVEDRARGTVDAGAPAAAVDASRAPANRTTLRCMTLARWSSIAA